MIGTMISNLMIKPGKSPVFESPADYGLPFRDVEFQTEDGVTLRGWLIEGGTDRVIIQTHFGVQCSRSGYTSKGKGAIKLWKGRISFLRQAKHLYDQGYSVLMYDMRNHGESDRGTCPWVSWGPEEAEDVIAAVRFVTSSDEYANANIGLLSICMGSSATTYAYGKGPAGLSQFDAIKAMMAVQPLTYPEFVKAMGIPALLANPGAAKSKERLGFDLNERTFVPDAAAITVPTLVLQNSKDPMTNPDLVQEYYNSLRVEKEIKWLDLAKNRAAAYDYLGTHPEVLSEFFGRFV